jgi:hypothetical protein
MRRAERGSIVGIVLGIAALLGCGDANAPAPVPDGGGPLDSGAPLDSGGGPSCAANIPATGFGTTVTSKLSPLAFSRCDGTPYAFYGEDFCAAELTVVTVSAGWSAASMTAAAALPALQADYAARGVRLLEVVYQDASFAAPTNTFCQAWVDRYSLTNVVVEDSGQVMQPYFPDGSLPMALVVDATGTIVFRELGWTTDFATLRAKLDELLAAP